MKNINKFSDVRLDISGCLYCGNICTARDLIPVRTFLDKPFPNNLHVFKVCANCNNASSNDEEHTAFMLRCFSRIKEDCEGQKRLDEYISALRREKNESITFNK